MSTGIIIFAIAGFFVSLFIMYRTEHGIPGIKKYNSDFILLDMRFRYNKKILYNTLESIGNKGMRAYRDFLFLDFFFIGCFLIVMIFISQNISSLNFLIYLLSGLAVSRSVFDVLENTLIITLIKDYPQKNNFRANICSWATTLKFISLYLWTAGVIIIYIYNIFN